MAVPVLDLVQVFDQQVAPARGIGKQRANLRERLRIDRTAFRPQAALRILDVRQAAQVTGVRTWHGLRDGRGARIARSPLEQMFCLRTENGEPVRV